MQIAFYNSQFGDWFDKAIAWKTSVKGLFSPFSHCEIVLSPSIRLAGETGTQSCISASPRDGGVRIKSIDLNDNHWFLVNYPKADERNPESLYFANKQLGKPYNWLGVFGFVVDNPSWMTERRRWFCSQFATTFFHQQQLLLDLVPARTSPQSLFLALMNIDGVTCQAPGGGMVGLDFFKRAAELDIKLRRE